MAAALRALHDGRPMLDVRDLQARDLRQLSPEALATAAEQMLLHIGQQSREIASQAQAIRWRDAKIERITFELARLKAWKFAARTERMSAEQRELFEETAAADEASLQAQLEALQTQAGAATTTPPEAKRRPRRQPLPEHLPRVEHRHEPECTVCECGQAMLRIGEDASERLDSLP